MIVKISTASNSKIKETISKILWLNSPVQLNRMLKSEDTCIHLISNVKYHTLLVCKFINDVIIKIDDYWINSILSLRIKKINESYHMIKTMFIGLSGII